MSDKYLELYKAAAGNYPEAYAFLCLFGNYCHAIDDLIDKGEPDEAGLLRALVTGNILYSSPFWTRHGETLGSIVRVVTIQYLQSVRHAHSPETWKRNWADVTRFCGNQMVLAIAALPECGNYDSAVKVAEALMDNSWKIHHDAEGTPT